MSIKICLYSVTYFRVSQARMLMLRSYIKPKQCNRQKLKHATLVFVLHLITNESFQLAYFLVYLSRISDGLNEKTTKQITNVSPRPTFKLKHSAGTYPTIDQKHRSFIFGLCLEINTCITDSDKPTLQKAQQNKTSLLALPAVFLLFIPQYTTSNVQFAGCLHLTQTAALNCKRKQGQQVISCCVKH